MNSRTFVNLCLAVLAVSAVVLDTAEVAALEYIVQDGDTLQALSQRFYGDSRQWQKIADANGLGSGGSFRPGQSILIPEEGDPDNPGAVVVSVAGSVDVVEPISGQAKRAEEGTGLLWQQVFRAGANAKAQLRVRDGAYLRVYPNTEFTMMGTIGDPMADEIIRLRIRMARGSIELAASDDARVRLEVLTDRGMAVLDGGEIYFGDSPGGFRIAVYRGLATFGRIRVGPGQGGVVIPDGSQQRVRSLLDAVKFTAGQETLGLQVSLGDQAPAYVRWEPVAGAKAFEAALLYEHDDEILAETRAGAGARSVGFALPDTGIFRARVRPVSEDGVPGPWATLAFVGLKATPALPPFLSDESGVLFVGSALIDFGSMPAGLAAFVGADKEPTLMVRAGTRVIVEGVGEHTLNVRARLGTKAERDGTDTQVQGGLSIRIEPIPSVEVSFSPSSLNPLDSLNKVAVTVRLADGADLPVLGEVPRVMAGGRSCVAKPTETEGEYRCELHPRVAPGLESLPIIVEGRGRSFVYESEFKVALPHKGSLQVGE